MGNLAEAAHMASVSSPERAVNARPEFVQISPRLLRPRIAELGKIKIGGHGKRHEGENGKPDWFSPIKYNHFVVRLRERDRSKDGREDFLLDEAVHKVVGKEPKTLNFYCLFDEPEQNFQYYLAAFDGKKERCRGNGLRAFDRKLGQEIPCTCPLLKQHEGKYDGPPRPAGTSCKPHGRLSVILEAADTYGGYYVFRTTSWETISNIAGALRHLRDEFGGLRGLPLQLVIYPATDQYEQGGRTRSSTSFKVAVVLRADYRTAYQVAAQAREWRSQFLLPASAEMAAEHQKQLNEDEEREATSIAREFHPEAVKGELVNGAQSDEDEDNVEIVEDADDEPNPIEQLLRRALKIAGKDQVKINQAIAEYELSELGAMIQEKIPDALKQAKEEIERDAAEAEAAATPATETASAAATSGAGATKQPLSLFDD